MSQTASCKKEPKKQRLGQMAWCTLIALIKVHMVLGRLLTYFQLVGFVKIRSISCLIDNHSNANLPTDMSINVKLPQVRACTSFTKPTWRFATSACAVTRFWQLPAFEPLSHDCHDLHLDHFLDIIKSFQVFVRLRFETYCLSLIYAWHFLTPSSSIPTDKSLFFSETIAIFCRSDNQTLSALSDKLWERRRATEQSKYLPSPLFLSLRQGTFQGI